MKVQTEEFLVDKVTPYGTVKKKTGLERVYVFVDEENRFRQCGYLHIAQDCITGLVDLDKDLGELIAEAVSELKGKKITYGGAAVSHQPLQEVEVLDELIGTSEE